MENLLEALTLYAEENLVSRLLREYTPQIRAAQVQADRLAKQHSEAGEWLEMLKSELETVSGCREQAFLLAGVSIGLELGRF